MGLIKKIIFYFLLTITGLLIPYIWYRIFKKAGHVYWKYILLPALYLWYLLLLRIPLFILVQYPLHLLGVATKTLSKLFVAVETYILDHEKGIGVLYGALFLVSFYIVPTESITQFESASAISTTVVFLAVLSFGLTVLAVLLYNLLSSISLAQGSLSIDVEKLPGVAVAAGAKQGVKQAKEKGAEIKERGKRGARKAGRAAKKGQEMADTGSKVYKDIQGAEEAGSKLVSSGVLRGSGPVTKTLLRGLGAISGEGILVGVVGGILLIVAMFIYALALSVFSFFIIGLIIGPAYIYVINVFGSLIISPLLGGAEVAGAYGDMFGTQFMNQYAVGIGEIGAVEQTGAMVSQTAAKIGCIAKGPACFRQWQLNNTKRPGSEDVGEQYGLSIDRFQVGQGKDLDIAYKDADYAIPISFTLSNPRRGLKGLSAENVSYRMVVKDSGKKYCDTGWTGVDAFNIREIPNPEDKEFAGNDIYPGTSASTGFQTITGNENGDNFTLKGCEMLQPALGGYKTVMLEVKYNYFSQSTLYFQGMSLQNLQSDSSIEKRMKKSKTADTPVKASINVNSPVLFDQNELESTTGGGQSASQPFAVRSSLDTGEFDLRYKVRNLSVRNSQQTTSYDNEKEECQFKGFDDRLLGLEPEAKENLIDSEAEDRDLWFSRENKPPIFGCVMVLENPQDISPTGETLTMGVEAEYTVALEQKIDGFKAYNSQCGARYNCPLLVTDYYNESVEKINYNNWMTECTGLDAGNGCTVVKGPEEEDDWDKRPLTGGDKVEKELEQGETAYDPMNMVQKPGIIAGPVLREGSKMDSEVYDLREHAVGLREDDYEDLIDSGESFIMFTPPGQEKDIRIRSIDRICNKDGSRAQKVEKAKNWMDGRSGELEDIAAFRIKHSDDAC